MSDLLNTPAPIALLVGGLVGIFLQGLRSLVAGQLVPGRTVDRLTSQWEARLAESHGREQLWQTAYERSEERANVQAQQLGELMTLARTTDALLRALPVATEARPRDPSSG